MQIATMIEKAPQGGYVLKQITLVENAPPLIEIVTYRSTLPEVVAYELALKQQTFREVAWFAPAAQQVEPPRPPMPPQPEEHLEMPKFAGGQGYQNGQDDHEVERLTAGIMGRTGRANAVVAFMFCTAVALSYNVRGLVA